MRAPPAAPLACFYSSNMRTRDGSSDGATLPSGREHSRPLRSSRRAARRRPSRPPTSESTILSFCFPLPPPLPALAARQTDANLYITKGGLQHSQQQQRQFSKRVQGVVHACFFLSVCFPSRESGSGRRARRRADSGRRQHAARCLRAHARALAPAAGFPLLCGDNQGRAAHSRSAWQKAFLFSCRPAACARWLVLPTRTTTNNKKQRRGCGPSPNALICALFGVCVLCVCVCVCVRAAMRWHTRAHTHTSAHASHLTNYGM